MGKISDLDKTGQQIIDWKLEIFSYVNQVIFLKSSLEDQLSNMKSNSKEFTSDDVNELEVLLFEVKNKIKELNGG